MGSRTLTRTAEPDRFEHGGFTVLDHRYGSAAGTPFVLVHGIGCGLAYFKPLAPLLAEHGRCTCSSCPASGTRRSRRRC